MAEESQESTMKWEYRIFLALCAIGLASQLWLLASEFTQSSLPLITRDSRGRNVLPAITVCFPLEFTIKKSEWLDYMAHILESSDNYEELKYADPVLWNKYQVCKGRYQLNK